MLGLPKSGIRVLTVPSSSTNWVACLEYKANTILNFDTSSVTNAFDFQQHVKLYRFEAVVENQSSTEHHNESTPNHVLGFI
jgi:hypothetical protein